jgi:hypothetical protein
MTKQGLCDLGMAAFCYKAVFVGDDTILDFYISHGKTAGSKNYRDREVLAQQMFKYKPVTRKRADSFNRVQAHPSVF